MPDRKLQPGDLVEHHEKLFVVFRIFDVHPGSSPRRTDTRFQAIQFGSNLFLEDSISKLIDDGKHWTYIGGALHA